MNEHTRQRHGLTTEDIKELRRPFPALSVGFLPVGKVQTRGGEKTMQFAVYMDSRTVSERLADIDPGWTEHYRPAFNAADYPAWLTAKGSTECVLSVRGVTRIDVGQLSPNAQGKIAEDDKHIKAAYSDAFKRAAVKFGVGAYLYAIPMLSLPQTHEAKKLWWTRTAGNVEKFGGLNPAGLAELRRRYQAIVDHPKFIERFGTVVDLGMVEPVDVDPVEDEDDDTPKISEWAASVLTTLAGYNGRSIPADTIRQRYLSAQNLTFEGELPKVLVSVALALQLDDQLTEDLRTMAHRAAFTEKPEDLVTLTDTLRTIAEERTAE